MFLDVSGIPPDVAYDCLCYFIASHIVSLYFVYLIVSFHDVEECILFDFKVFLASGGEGTWWNIALLNETQSPQQLQQVLLEPRCRTKWTNTKDTEKDEKSLLLFVHVCCNVEDWYKIFESRNSGIGEKFHRQRNYSNYSYAGPRR